MATRTPRDTERLSQQNTMTSDSCERNIMHQIDTYLKQETRIFGSPILIPPYSIV